MNEYFAINILATETCVYLIWICWADVLVMWEEIVQIKYVGGKLLETIQKTGGKYFRTNMDNTANQICGREKAGKQSITNM